MGHYTDAPEDNLLGITDKQLLNEEEARGEVRAEAFLLDLELPVEQRLLAGVEKLRERRRDG